MRMRVIIILFLIAALIATAATVRAEPMCVMQVFASGGLRVRTEPSLDGTAVYLLDDRETVLVLEERDGWYRVGKNIPPHVELGWVCGEYLR